MQEPAPVRVAEDIDEVQAAEILNRPLVLRAANGATIIITPGVDGSYITSTRGLDSEQFWVYKQAMAYFRRGDAESYGLALAMLGGIGFFPEAPV
jgi:hypothetical protein